MNLNQSITELNRSHKAKVDTYKELIEDVKSGKFLADEEILNRKSLVNL